MNYKIKLFTLLLLILFGCETPNNYKKKTISIDQEKKYKNLGFALIYNNNLEKIKKLDARSLQIYHKLLKRKSMVKIVNPDNGNFLIFTTQF